MQTVSIKPDDIVQLDIRGDRFYGFVRRIVEERPREFIIQPISNGRGSIERIATSRQIIGHYAKRKGSA